jgi:hypothetical protein
MQFKQLDSWESALRIRGRNAASNAFLEGANMLTRAVGLQHRAEYRLWNTYAEEAREALHLEVFPRLFAVIDANSEIASTTIGGEFLKEAAWWDLSHVVMEHVYSDLVSPRFYSLIFEIYRAGHFPCNWDEVWPNGKLWVL